MRHPKLNYRADIDGLRAIAVLSVVFYHAGFGLFCGGFVGVDVFFVISGYLITTIIVQEIYDGRFSIARFYERRIRRIFPALFAMIAFTLAVGAYLLDADIFRATSESAVAATVFMSNHLFWLEAGYFDTPTYFKPLLHTWSLAIEEQFYIFFPLLLLVSHRFLGKRIKPALVVMAVASFLASIYYIQQGAAARFQDFSTAFYLAPLRAWELMIGGMLAVNMIPSNIRPTYRNLLCIAGFAMIFACVFFYSADMPFPGAAALLPVLGAALIVYSGIEGEIAANRILGTRPLVFIGQISYSLYLFHWPIIIFGKYYYIRSAPTLVMLSWLGIAFILSVLSWKFIETPFRSKTFMSQANIFRLAALSMALTILAGATIYFRDGFPDRFDAQYASFPRTASAEKTWGNCKRDADITDLCSIGGKTDKPVFLVWGDSHAESMAPAIDKSAKGYGVGGLIVFNTGCPPLLGDGQLQGPLCYEYDLKAISYIENHPDLKTVILVARWAPWAEGTSYFPKGAESITLSKILFSSSTHSDAALFESGLNGVIQKLVELHRDAVIVLQTPEIGYHVPASWFIAARTGRDVNQIIAPTLDDYLNRNKLVISTVAAIQQRYNIRVMDPSNVLCKKDICLAALENRPLYVDDNHLSLYGSRYVSPIFDALFANLGKTNSP